MGKKINEKPWGDGEDYNRYILSELESFRKNAWKKQITNHFGERRSLKILDVGTGPGFFACILAEEGHEVTAIDYSEGMLSCAKNNAKALGVDVDFKIMDVNNLSFDDCSFDVIVTRNVTWTLEYPAKVYNEFKRVLKEGGLLLIYDANWHLHFFDEDLYNKVIAREENYFKKYGQKEVVAVKNMEFFEKAPLTKCNRPEWDKKALQVIGMEIKIQNDIGENVYEEWEKELYGESPLFEICAIK